MRQISSDSIATFDELAAAYLPGILIAAAALLLLVGLPLGLVALRQMRTNRRAPLHPAETDRRYRTTLDVAKRIQAFDIVTALKNSAPKIFVPAILLALAGIPATIAMQNMMGADQGVSWLSWGLTLLGLSYGFLGVVAIAATPHALEVLWRWRKAALTSDEWTAARGRQQQERPKKKRWFKRIPA